MKQLLLTGFLLVSLASLKSQNIKFDIRENKYAFGSTEYVLTTFSFINNSGCRMWLLGIDNKNDNAVDSLLLKKLFWENNEGEDASLFQIAFDGNVSSYTPILFRSFAKIVDLNSRFEFQILSSKVLCNETKKRIDHYLNANVVGVQENKYIKKYAPPSDAVIFYKGLNILLNYEDIHTEINNK